MNVDSTSVAASSATYASNVGCGIDDAPIDGDSASMSITPSKTGISTTDSSIIRRIGLCIQHASASALSVDSETAACGHVDTARCFAAFLELRACVGAIYGIQRSAIGENDVNVAADVDARRGNVIILAGPIIPKWDNVRGGGDRTIHHIPSAAKFMVTAGEFSSGMGL